MSQSFPTPNTHPFGRVVTSDAVGAPEAAFVRCESELEAVRAALEWAREGDLLILTTHAQRDQVIGLLEGLRKVGWKPGEPVAEPTT